MSQEEITIQSFPQGPINTMSDKNRRRYYNPWMRLFARVLDFNIAAWLFSMSLNMIAYFLPKSLVTQWEQQLTVYLQSGTSHVVFYIVAACLMVLSYICLWCLVIEPWFLSRCGYTPGKYLFNLKVTYANGQLLIMRDAYSRSWRMWFYGCAIGLPLISLVTSVKAYFNLRRIAATTWDKNRFIITHKPCNWVRKIIIFILYILPAIIIAVGLIALLAHGVH